MTVGVSDLEWNPDLPNAEPQCIMMFKRAHIHRKSNVYLKLQSHFHSILYNSFS